MPNLFIIFVLFIGLYLKKKMGLKLGILFGLYLDIVLGSSIGIYTICLGGIGLLGEILSKNFSKDSRLIVTLMVIISTILFETVAYIIGILRAGGDLEMIAFFKILALEILFNTLITIIIYPIIKKAGYYLENLYDDKFMITRYF